MLSLYHATDLETFGQLACAVLGALPEQSAFNPQAMTWRLYDCL
nr:exodeoxyribonuclease V subunit gamma [Pseudomonas sp. BMS12]